MKNIYIIPIAAAFLIAGLVSCASVPNAADIPPEMSVAELNQKAQEAFDQSNFAAAEVYYNTIIQRFGTDIKVLTAAEFEIAHLRMKQKDWIDARIRLENIIARYMEGDPSALPAEYYVLARNDLARIPEEQ